jgi:hypothetical protein
MTVGMPLALIGGEVTDSKASGRVTFRKGSVA